MVQAKLTFIGKGVFIPPFSETSNNMFKFFKLKYEKIITSQYSIQHCTFLIHHCTNWSSLPGADPGKILTVLRASAKREELGGPGAEPPEKFFGPRPSDPRKTPCFNT